MIVRVLHLANEVVVLSEAWRRSIAEIVPAQRISVIANPVECQRPNLSDRGSTKYDVLYLGGFHENKGVYVLLEALSGLRDRFPDLKVCCAGGGDLEEFAAVRGEFNLDDSVEIHGWVDKQVRDDLLSSSAIFVLPSFAEGLPMSVLEAMASGLPVVVSAIGGIPDLIDSGNHGILIEPGDVEGLRAALEELLSSPDVRQRMGAEGRSRVLQEYSVDVIIPQVMDIYRRYNAAILEA